MNTATPHATDVSPVLEIVRSFDAPPARVSDAWLVREQWQAWIGPEGVQCEVPLLEPPRVPKSLMVTWARSLFGLCVRLS